jgi:NAD(P)-dependent dehydrogenase (short-subunit alcohol dehydrogenase family)
MKLDSTIAAIITGGGSGLGAATARRLAGFGVKVALFGRNVARGEAVAQELGGIFCGLDINSESELDAAFAKARVAHGQERILVNCAGTGHTGKTVSRDRVTGHIAQFPSAEFERVLQVNLLGTFLCIVRSAAGMLTVDALDDGERGVILNTSSIAAEDGKAGQAAYAASKAAIVGMTLPLARDLMNEGIRVNTIMPGFFDTPMMEGVNESMRAVLAASVPFPKRLGAPEEYAALAEAVIRNTYMNGTSIRLDGAIRMSPR